VIGSVIVARAVKTKWTAVRFIVLFHLLITMGCDKGYQLRSAVIGMRCNTWTVKYSLASQKMGYYYKEFYIGYVVKCCDEKRID
jgi:hypothetical protein